MNITKTSKVTYLGVLTSRFEVRQSGASGKRCVVTRWHSDAVGQPVVYEAGSVVVTPVTGNFNRGTGVTHSDRKVVLPPNTTDAQAIELAERLIGEL